MMSGKLSVRKRMSMKILNDLRVENWLQVAKQLLLTAVFALFLIGLLPETADAAQCYQITNRIQRDVSVGGGGGPRLVCDPVNTIYSTNSGAGTTNGICTPVVRTAPPAMCGIPPAIDCVGRWSAYGACTGAGCSQTRTYSISVPASGGGAACPFADGETQTRTCAAGSCVARVDCQGSWSSYGSCSASCGDGTQTRTYNVTRPASGGGAACPFADGATQNRACNNGACAAPGVNRDCAGYWMDTGSCSNTCGLGIQSQTFVVTQTQSGTGAACPRSPRGRFCHDTSSCPATDPDLTISSLNMTAGSLTPGDTVELSAEVRNSGSAGTGGTFSNRLRYRVNSIWTTISSIASPALSVGGRHSGAGSFVVPNNPGASVDVQYCADTPDNDIAELSEGNNCRLLNLGNIPSSYTVDVTPTGEAMTAGQVISSEGGLDCYDGAGADCNEEYAEGLDITLTGVLANGSVNFTGDCVGTDTCTISGLGADSSVSADFVCDAASGYAWTGSACELPLPDVAVSGASAIEGAIYDPIAGEFSGHEMVVEITNTSINPVPDSTPIPYEIRNLDAGGAVVGSGDIVTGAINEADTESHTLAIGVGLAPGTYRMQVILYPDASIDSDSLNNTGEDTLGLALSDPETMDIDFNLDVVRSGDNADVIVTVESSTFSVVCELVGPLLQSPVPMGSLSYTPSDTIGNITAGPGNDFGQTFVAGPLTSTSLYTLTCTEPVTGTVFDPVSGSVDVVPTIEET